MYSILCGVVAATDRISREVICEVTPVDDDDDDKQDDSNADDEMTVDWRNDLHISKHFLYSENLLWWF